MDDKDAQIAELKAKIAELEGAAKTQKEALDTLKVEQEKVRLQKEDNDWNELKTTIIPPGLVKAPEDELNLRKLQKEDNGAFLRAIVTKRAPGTKPEGQTHVQKSGDPDTEDPVAKQNRILGTKTHIPGRLH